jgi:hypothetical protein
MFMILFVLDDPNLIDKVLESWSSIGVSGATTIESTGLNRRLQQHIPMRYTYGSDFPGWESGNITLLVMVQSEAMVQKCLQAAENVVGDLDQPNTGVFSAWPLSFSKGVPGINETRD